MKYAYTIPMHNKCSPAKIILSVCLALVIGLSAFFNMINVDESNAASEFKNNSLVISAGSTHTLAIINGGLYAWGNYGVIGFYADPISGRLGTESNWVDVSAGYYHSLAINSSGELYAWGGNEFGQLGDGTEEEKYAPIKIGSETNWVSISAGHFHSLAINSLGELYAWGWNNYGELGDGTNEDKKVPTKIGDATNWVSVLSLNNKSFAINDLGELYAWGWNYDGELGDGTSENKNAPEQIGIGKNWIAISGGTAHAIALNDKGELWSWGDNLYGQLGDGTGDNKNVPVRVGNQSNWTKISTGEKHTFAINSLGELWGWGSNNNGQLGNGEGGLGNKNTPIRLGSKTNWSNISAGYQHAFAINNLGELWTWGANMYKQLGLIEDSDEFDILEPVEVIIWNKVLSPNSGTGYTVSAPSQEHVPFGGSYTFTITLSSGYTSPIVGLTTTTAKVNLTSIKKNVYTYKISNVTGEILAPHFTIDLSRV